MASTLEKRAVPVSTATTPGQPISWGGLLAGPAAVILSAVLLTLACPPYDQSWLAWGALAPFFWVMLRGTHPQPPPSRKGTLPLAEGAAGFAVGCKEVPTPPWREGVGGGSVLTRAPAHPRTPTSPPIPPFPHSPIRTLLPAYWLGFLFLVLHVPWFAAFTPFGYPIAAAYWGLLTAGVMVVTRRGVARAPGLAPLLLACGWVGVEWLRAQGPLAFPWGQLAMTQYRNLPVLQALDLTGSYGLSLLIALVAASLAALAHPPLRRAGLRWGAVAVGIFGVWTARGLVLLHSRPPDAGKVRVAVVQASESQARPGAAVVCISRPWDYLSRTAEAVREGAELVLWPESASEEDLFHDAYARERVHGILAGSETHLLAGSFVVHPESGQDTNAAVMLSPRAEPLGQYAKVLIVPFGEYLPLRPLLGWTEQLGVSPKDLRAGEGWNPLPWARGTVGTNICYESAFSAPSRAMVAGGADLLAVLTSDGWAGRDAVGKQHLAFAPLRAVENRRSIARAAATGVSELIDPYGRVLQAIPMFQKGVAVGTLPRRRDQTYYNVLGDWPVGLSLLIVLAAVLLPARRLSGTGWGRM